MKPSLVILAAGIGSRYGGLKQIDSVGPNGEAIIDYSIYDAIQAGFGKIIFIIRESILEEFKAFVAGKFHIPMAYAIQEDSSVINKDRVKPWGTGHAVLSAADSIDTPFAVINADDFYGRDAYHQAYEFLMSEEENSNAALVGYRLGYTLSEHGTVSRGYCTIGPDGNLEEIQELTKIWKENDIIFYDNNGEKSELPSDGLVSMNFWCFSPDILPHFKTDFTKFLVKNKDNPNSEFYIPDVVHNQVSSHQAKVKVLSTSSNWFGITYREDKPYVQEAVTDLIKKGIYPSRVWN